MTEENTLQFCPLEYAYLSPKLLPSLPTAVTTNVHFKVKQKHVLPIKTTKEPVTPKKKLVSIDPFAGQLTPEKPSTFCLQIYRA